MRHESRLLRDPRAVHARNLHNGDRQYRDPYSRHCESAQRRCQDHDCEAKDRVYAEGSELVLHPVGRQRQKRHKKADAGYSGLRGAGDDPQRRCRSCQRQHIGPNTDDAQPCALPCIPLIFHKSSLSRSSTAPAQNGCPPGSAFSPLPDPGYRSRRARRTAETALPPP